MPRPIVVAIAAPVTPSAGNGPTPNTSIGPSTMLMPLASHSVRIAIAGSPAPRKAALIMNSKITVTLPPSMTRGKRPPIAITSGDAPIAASRRCPANAPTTPTTTASPSPSAMACTAARAAPLGSFSPMRRATIAAPPIDNPIANE